MRCMLCVVPYIPYTRYCHVYVTEQVWFGCTCTHSTRDHKMVCVRTHFSFDRRVMLSLLCSSFQLNSSNIAFLCLVRANVCCRLFQNQFLYQSVWCWSASTRFIWQDIAYVLCSCVADGMQRYRYQSKMKCFSLYKLFSLWPPEIGIELKRISYIDWIAVAQTHASQCFVIIFFSAFFKLLIDASCAFKSTPYTHSQPHKHSCTRMPYVKHRTMQSMTENNNTEEKRTIHNMISFLHAFK